jgi:hypothetical protein
MNGYIKAIADKLLIERVGARRRCSYRRLSQKRAKTGASNWTKKQKISTSTQEAEEARAQGDFGVRLRRRTVYDFRLSVYFKNLLVWQPGDVL